VNKLIDQNYRYDAAGNVVNITDGLRACQEITI